MGQGSYPWVTLSCDGTTGVQTRMLSERLDIVAIVIARTVSTADTARGRSQLQW